MKKRLFAFICLIATSAVAGDSVVMRVGNVLGDPEEGGEPHHMVRTQRYFAKLVWEKTGGEGELRFLEGKSLPTFQMLGMVTKGRDRGYQCTRLLPVESARARRANDPLFVRRSRARAEIPAVPGRGLSGGQNRERLRRPRRFLHADCLERKHHALEPIRMPGDFEGKKVANIWELYRAMYDGYPPAHLREVGYRESVEGGLVSGEFDVAIGQLQNNHHQKLYEYYTHQTVAPWLYNIYYTFIVNADFWNRLTAEQH